MVSLANSPMQLIFSQLCLVAGLQLAVTTGSPVEKVVELIKELKGKIETDAANEQKIYDKFACWSAAAQNSMLELIRFEIGR